MALTPSATPLATRRGLRAGPRGGHQAAGHQPRRPRRRRRTTTSAAGKAASSGRAEMLLAARELGMAVQVNTSVCRRNVDLFDEMAEFLAALGHRHVGLVLPRAGGPRRRGRADQRRGIRSWSSRSFSHWSQTTALRREDDRGPALPAVRHAAGRQSPGRAGTPLAAAVRRAATAPRWA